MFRLLKKNNQHCVFCDMIANSNGHVETEFIFEDTKVFVIPDIKPDADHHYLVIPKEHILTPKSLTGQHISLVRHMIEVAKRVLEQRCFPGHSAEEFAKEYRLGFHWPPFHSIDHVHMHVLYPVSSIPTMQKLAFRPGIGFMPVDSVLDRITNMPDNPEHSANGKQEVEEMECS